MVVEIAARMSWYRMFDNIQSVRVMGVAHSFRMMPFCRSSALMFSTPDMLAVITAIAMMPGTKNSMKRYFRASIDVWTVVMNAGFPDKSWFITAKTEFRICIFVDTEVELGS